MTATRDATPTVREGGGEPKESDDLVEDSPFDPPRERFEARGELGRGGMGRVTDAYDRALHRPVAIKEMLAASGLDLARFEREARITAKLEHPGIVPIHDAGRTADGTPFYVMRRIDGRPLDQLIEDKLEVRLALIPNVLAACDAVAFAHARSVVHRDIKPTNILVGPFGETLVIDWGIARELERAEANTAIAPSSDAKLTRAGTIAGTPGFMAPEQARGESVDARADVFALGATLFFVLAGQQPYGAASATEMVDLAGAGREPDWKRLPRDVPPELRAIAKKAMAIVSDERYADAGALATDLRRFITGNLVAAYEYGFIARLGVFVKRHRAAVAVAAISAALLFAVGIVALRGIVAERDQATLASARAQLAADRLLVQHARELADSDPVAAVIALRSIAANPDVSRAAWIAASAAFVHGIPYGFESTTGGLVQISRDNTRALVAGWNDNTVTLIDLIARTSRVVTHDCTDASAAVWLGRDHAVCIGTPVHVVDLVTGKVRSIDVRGSEVLGDRGSRVWILTHDGRLLELDDPDGEPREIAHGVTQVNANDDLDLALLQYGTHWVMRTRDGEIPLPADIEANTGYVSAHRIAVYDQKALHIWRVDGNQLVDPLVIPATSVISAAITDQMVFMFTPRGLVPFDNKGIEGTVNPMLGMVLPTAHGCIHIAEDGSLRIRDELGWVRIERHANELRHVDISPDERFVVATTAGGETLVWDLHALLPIRVRVSGSASLTALTDNAAWLWSPAVGVVRVDLHTRKVETTIDEPAVMYAMIDPAERWVGGGRADNSVFVEDLTTHQKLTIRDAAIAVNDGDGLTAERPDGTLWRWTPGTVELRKVGSLGGEASLMAARSSWDVAIVDHQLVRIDTRTNAREHIAAPLDVDVLQITETGRVWILAAHRVWQWDRGSTVLTRVPTTEAINDISADSGELVMSSTRSVTTVHDGELLTTPVQSGTTVGVNRHAAVIRDDRANIIVLDLRSGASFALPVRTTQNIVAMHDNRIAAMTDVDDDGQVLSVWNIDVPEQPLALEAWLATITNARPVGVGEVYTWPGL
ncbi:MAG TPA: serine/threonine-protein kinase [Kofleriaceae bacterium]